MGTTYTASNTGTWTEKEFVNANGETVVVWDTLPPTTVPFKDVINIQNGAEITIPEGTTVTLDNAFVQLLDGTLIVEGTLNIIIYTNAWQTSVITGGFSGLGNIAVKDGGTLNINSKTQPHDGYYSVLGIAISKGNFTNEGTLNIASSTKSGSGWGILMQAGPGSTFTNAGTINTLSEIDPSQGLGPACAIEMRSGTFINQTGGVVQIGNSDSVGSSIIIDNGANLTNEGSIQNFGALNNQGAFENSNDITFNFPGATYTGVPIAPSPQTESNAGETISALNEIQDSSSFNFESSPPANLGQSGSSTSNIYIAGTIDSSISLDSLGSSDCHFEIQNETELILNSAFTIPTNYTLYCNGSLEIAKNEAILTNEGTVYWNFNTAKFNPTYPGHNDGMGSGKFILSGTMTSLGEMDLHKLGENFAIKSGNSVTVGNDSTLLVHNSVTLTIESNATLTTTAISSTGTQAGILSIGGLINNNGTITNSGIMKYMYPYIRNNGYIQGNSPTELGEIALVGPIGESLNLSILPAKRFLVLENDTFNVNATLTIPADYSLKVYSNYFDVTDVIVIEGEFQNDGEFSPGAASFVHVFPSASYSGNLPENIKKISIQGVVDSGIDLGSIGYGKTKPFHIDQNTELNVQSSFAISSNCILENSGSIRADSSGSVVLNGKLIQNFDTASFSCSKLSGSGIIGLNGTINESDTFSTLVSMFSEFSNFEISMGKSLLICTPVTIPSGIAFDVYGTLSVFSIGELTVQNPTNPTPPNTVSATIRIRSTGTFDNSAIINVENTNNIGIWFEGGNHSNSGIINAQTEMGPVTHTRAAILLTSSTLQNTSGTINCPSGDNAEATIFCNNSTICGGTYTGSAPLENGPNKTPAYSSTCS